MVGWQDEPSAESDELAAEERVAQIEAAELAQDAELEQTEDFDVIPPPEANESIENTNRLIALTQKIDRYPEAPVNYVLRGEIYLSIGDNLSAETDFRQAIALSEQRDPELDWGYLNTAFLDRAVEGLRQVS